jgi:hypothetical protein
LVAGDLNNDAAAGEGGDDFVFALGSLRGSGDGEEGCEDEGGEKRQAEHDEFTLPQWLGLRV